VEDLAERSPDRPYADIGSAIQLASIVQEIRSDGVNDPAFAQLLDAERLTVKRINRRLKREPELAELRLATTTG
jgi:hypothetical protein